MKKVCKSDFCTVSNPKKQIISDCNMKQSNSKDLSLFNIES